LTGEVRVGLEVTASTAAMLVTPPRGHPLTSTFTNSFAGIGLPPGLAAFTFIGFPAVSAIP
jgi:hypothetical protein